MKFDFDKSTKRILVFSLLLVAFSFFYYYVILPTINWLSLNNCLGKVELEYQAQVKKMYGLDLKSSDLTYSEFLKGLEEYYQRNLNYCFEKYPRR